MLVEMEAKKAAGYLRKKKSHKIFMTVPKDESSRSKTWSKILCRRFRLFSASGIRDRANAMLADALEGKTNFKVCRDIKIPAAAKRVINVAATRYPEGCTPVHSRWGHFNTEKKKSRKQNF